MSTQHLYKPRPERWLTCRFSLKAVFVSMTITALGFSWLVHVAQERRAMRAWIEARGGSVRGGNIGIKHFGWALNGPRKKMLPFGDWRRQVYDYVAEIDVPSSVTEEEKTRIQTIFPRPRSTARYRCRGTVRLRAPENLPAEIIDHL